MAKKTDFKIGQALAAKIFNVVHGGFDPLNMMLAEPGADTIIHGGADVALIHGGFNISLTNKQQVSKIEFKLDANGNVIVSLHE